MSLKPWRLIAEPHRDVREGKFLQAEFAADLSRVHAGNASEEYQNPVLFYQRTFITEGMRLLLDSVVRRLSGKGGDPVIQLQTAFGGGKTHTILAVYHLAKGEVPTSELQGVSQILDMAGITELPKARIAVLDGVELLGLASKPHNHDGIEIHTLWGKLAYQLGGAAGYEKVKAADLTGTAPGKAELVDLLSASAPCVILVDELVRYVSQFEEGRKLSGGTYDTQLSFVQALTEAVSAVPTAILLASLPQSGREAGSQQGILALRSLMHYFARNQALWKPVATAEAFEIVRRRLFSNIRSQEDMEEVCKTFADYYISNKDDFPQETQESGYRHRLRQAYPIHPEFFDRLYEDWSTLDNFQRTRGVLKLMAKIIYRLWKDGNNDPLIMPGNLPLMDMDTRSEALYYLPQGWDPVIERDVDGDRSQTWEIENKDTRLGSVQACRRIARTIFLGSAPATSVNQNRGIDHERILLGAVQPGQKTGLYMDALMRLTEKLHYLNVSDRRFWLDTRPNLRREMEERKRRFSDAEDVLPLVQHQIHRSLTLSPVHVFTSHSDIPDDFQLRYVVLPLTAAYSKSGRNLAEEAAKDILTHHGTQPRYKQNRLVFIAPDAVSVSRLRDIACSYLAWNSIVNDYKSNRLVLDNLMAKQAEESCSKQQDVFRRTVREAWRWLLTPVQDAIPGKGISDIKWESYPLNPGASNWSKEITDVLQENELVISAWAPIHLAKMLKDWFWTNGAEDVNAVNVWQQTCQMLYLPRLKDSDVFRNAIAQGVSGTDFFGTAQGKEEDRYLGFVFGKTTSIILDSSLLLIERNAAADYAASINKPQPSSQPGLTEQIHDPHVGEKPAIWTNPPTTVTPEPTKKTAVKRFFGSIELDSIKAKSQFADIVNEVIQNFTTKTDVTVRISIDIEAVAQKGFDDGTVRAVKENCNALNFKQAEFEEE